VTVTVVGRAFLRVGQDLVGFLGAFELFLGLFAVRVAVRVVLHRQLAICLAQLVVRGVFRYAEDFI